MRLLIIAIFLLGSISVHSQHLYDLHNITEIKLEFYDSNWNDLLIDNYSTGQRILASAIINGESFDSVGVRCKGHSSYDPCMRKFPLNIKLNYIKPNQKYGEYGTIKLANGAFDESFIHEVLSYKIAREYMPAPLSNFAKLYINQNYAGLYISSQDVDGYFVNKHYKNKDAMRIKGICSLAHPLGLHKTIWLYLNSNMQQYKSLYHLQNKLDWSKLIEFLDILNHAPHLLESVYNVDQHLWFLAYSNLLVNLDGPLNNGQNYYLLEDATGRLNICPWDLNMSFGGFSMIVHSNDFYTDTQLIKLNPFFNADVDSICSVSKILNVPKWRKNYIAHYKTLLQQNFSQQQFLNDAYALHNFIDAEYQLDSNMLVDYLHFSQSIDGIPNNDLHIGLKSFMQNRTDYLTQLDCFNVQAPEIFANEVSPVCPSVNSTLNFSAKFLSSDSAFLMYRYSDFGPFYKAEMFDDGQHNDGVANDNIYGVSILPQSNYLLYYFYASNAEASSFLPQKAEFETYTVYLKSDLVINEFLASNSQSAYDQDGEADDWIELFNNTETEIELTGYSLSDDFLLPDKWILPDTSIAPKDYLILWADKDENQNGLHTSFKLSATGECLYLYNQSQQLVDHVCFNHQQVDTSFGRLPNGTGQFQPLIPTYSAENMSLTEMPIVETFAHYQIYPNPVSSNLHVLCDSLLDMRLKVYSMSGNLVKTQSFLQSEQVVLNVQDLSVGMYVLKITSGKHSVFQKFLKQ